MKPAFRRTLTFALKGLRMLQKNVLRTALVSGLGLAIGSANAVFTVPAEVTDAVTSVGLVGAAVFTIAVGVKLYKWIKGAL